MQDNTDHGAIYRAMLDYQAAHDAAMTDAERTEARLSYERAVAFAVHGTALTVDEMRATLDKQGRAVA